MTYTLHYTSADGPESDASWSVYSEEYETIDSPEPIPGSTKHIASLPTEIQANHLANVRQRDSYRIAST